MAGGVPRLPEEADDRPDRRRRQSHTKEDAVQVVAGLREANRSAREQPNDGTDERGLRGVRLVPSALERVHA